MPIYKLLHERHVESLVTGRNFHLGTFSKYRAIEAEGIGDKLEGSVELAVDRLPVGEEQDPDVVKAKENLSPYFSNETIEVFFNPKVEFLGNSFITQTPNRHIFCASHILDREVIARMRLDSEQLDNEPYDYAVPIMDINGFGAAVALALHLSEQRGQVNRMGFFPLFEYQKVSYQRRHFAVTESVPTPDFFIKDVAFSTQKECRYVFQKRIPNNRMHTTLNVRFLPLTFGEPIKLDDLLRSGAK